MKKPSEVKKVVAQIFKNVAAKKMQCLEPACEEYSVNSHLLQRNGILNSISNKGHLIEVRPKDLWNLDEHLLDFKLIGIKSAIALPIFCNYHDSALFKNIESETIDFNGYESQLLFSYRTLCAEIRKKERNILIFERELNSKVLKNQINESNLKVILDSTKEGIKQLKNHKLILEEEISDPKNYFEFVTYEYSLIKVYGSALFSPIDYDYVKTSHDILLKHVFIHVIPHNGRLVIIIGFRKSHKSEWIENFADSWKDLSILELEIKLTDLFATRIESWGMSPLLYNTISSINKKKFIKYCENNAMNFSVNQNIAFNLFEGRIDRI